MKIIAVTVGNILLAYDVVLLLATAIPFLSDTQISPYYSTILVVWTGVSLLATLVW